MRRKYIQIQHCYYDYCHIIMFMNRSLKTKTQLSLFRVNEKMNPLKFKLSASYCINLKALK